MSDTKEQTTVTQVNISPEEMNEFLGIPGAENVILPEDEKPNFFSAGGPDLSFIEKKDKKVEKKDEKKDDKADEKKDDKKDEKTETVDEIINGEKDQSQESNQGRPKVVKDALIEATKKLIEKNLLVPFDDDKKIEDYTAADFEELIEANFKDKEQKLREETPVEFFDSLPEELQYAAKYVMDGGTELKKLFKALAEVEEARELSAEEPKDQETIVRQYLSVTNFGTPEEIDEEITSWKDLGKLETKASQMKPKLDRMRQEQVTHKIAQQEKAREQQVKASQNYTNSVYEVLKTAEVNGLKMDKKTQGMLYSGMIQPQYPSISGKPTNLLGHLLEKYQFVEPNLGLITEALWLLSDPDGYRAKVKEQAAKETTENIVRKLKNEESKKSGSSPVVEKDETKTRTIPRNNNFFKR